MNLCTTKFQLSNVSSKQSIFSYNFRTHWPNDIRNNNKKCTMCMLALKFKLSTRNALQQQFHRTLFLYTILINSKYRIFFNLKMLSKLTQPLNLCNSINMRICTDLFSQIMPYLIITNRVVTRFYKFSLIITTYDSMKLLYISVHEEISFKFLNDISCRSFFSIIVASHNSNKFSLIVTTHNSVKFL